MQEGLTSCEGDQEALQPLVGSHVAAPALAAWPAQAVLGICERRRRSGAGEQLDDGGSPGLEFGTLLERQHLHCWGQEQACSSACVLQRPVPCKLYGGWKYSGWRQG